MLDSASPPSPWRDFWHEERGSVTAEFALTVPAVLLILGIAVGSVYLAAERVSLVSLAGEVAQLEARGDGALAAHRLAEHPGASIARMNDGRMLCVEAKSVPGAGLLSIITVTGRGCAAISTAGIE